MEIFDVSWSQSFPPTCLFGGKFPTSLNCDRQEEENHWAMKRLVARVADETCRIRRENISFPSEESICLDLALKESPSKLDRFTVSNKRWAGNSQVISNMWEDYYEYNHRRHRCTSTEIAAKRRISTFGIPKECGGSFLRMRDAGARLLGV
jgi:hypothetical protein